MTVKNGTRVTVNDQAGKIVKSFKNGKAKIELEDGTSTTTSEFVVRRPGRKSLEQSIGAEAVAEQVKDFLGDLGKAKSQDEKKRLRRLLRRRGHRGGLGKAKV